MKKVVILIFTALFFIATKDVFAMDNVYSLNKNKDERFVMMKNSYNEKHNVDGIVAGGSYRKAEIELNDEKYEDYQVMLVKYNKNGNVIWNYTYGKTSKDKLDYLTYSYDSDSNVDGYIVVLKNTYDIDQPIEDKPSLTTILKVGLDGKLVWEKSANLNKKETITKIIPTYNTENKVEGYVAIGTITNEGIEDTALIVKYDNEFNIVWEKEYKNPDYTKTSYTDIVNLYEDNKVIGYITIRLQTNDNKTKQTDLIRFNLDGNEEKNIDNTLNKYESINLQEANNGFIIYGKTSNIKLKKGTITYFILKYSIDDTEEWETIGDIELDTKGKVIVNPEKNAEKITGYNLLCSNKENASFHVVKIDEEGNIKRKIKKITNDYYDIEDYIINTDTIFFVGQIICPEDDNCEYDTNSLFLVSDEDKVIEVEDKQSANVMIFICVFIIGCVSIAFYRRKKVMN
jgi:hypothetical protein